MYLQVNSSVLFEELLQVSRRKNPKLEFLIMEYFASSKKMEGTWYHHNIIPQKLRNFLPLHGNSALHLTNHLLMVEVSVFIFTCQKQYWQQCCVWNHLGTKLTLVSIWLKLWDEIQNTCVTHFVEFNEESKMTCPTQGPIVFRQLLVGQDM